MIDMIRGFGLVYEGQAASWGRHILWDFTISHIRTIASGIQHPELTGMLLYGFATPLPGLKQSDDSSANRQHGNESG